MGILSSITTEKRSAPWRTDQTAPGWVVRWLGGGQQSDAGVTVNEHTALNTMVVAASVRILSETVASLPLPVFERMQPRGRERARDHSLYSVLHDEANPLMTSFTWRERVMAHLALWGNHYSEIDNSGDVAALWPLHPSVVEPRFENGDLAYLVHESGQRRQVPRQNMLHISGLAMDGVVGLSPLAMMRQAIGVSVAAESYAGRFFANDARPSVLLKHPGQLQDTARENLRTSWQEMYGGASRSHGVAILEEGLDVATLSMPMQDAQFLETRKFEVQEFARFFRIPPHLLADVERSTSWGSGIEQQNIGFIVHTIRPWLVRIEQEINRKLFPRYERPTYYAEFVIDGLLRGDMNSRKEFYASGRQWGYMSANDILEMENRNPIPGGDVYLQPMNMVPAGENPLEPDVDNSSGERTASEPEFRFDLPRGSIRSATARRRLANAHQTVYRDAIARLLRYERNEVRRAIDKHLKQRGKLSFEQWVKDFYYEDYPERFRRDMWAPVQALMEVSGAEAADEVNSDPPSSEDLDTFVDEYVKTMAERHAGFSRSRLLKTIHDHREARQDDLDDPLIDDLEDDLEDWEDRAATEGHDEAHRSSNAAAYFVYGAAGVAALRWITAGSDPCDYCQSLNGTVVGYDEPFLPSGQGLAPGGIDPFSSQSDIKHAPLHSGCECLVSAG